MTTPELQVAQAAARAGGEVVMRYFREGVVMRGKQSYNLVSDADVEAEQAIARVIQATYPEHAIMGEETFAGDAAAEHLWIVDPLDGTNNFAHRLPQFAVSVAYYHRGEPQCGAIYDPVHDVWHTAELGQGAYCNGQRVHVGDETRLDQVIIGCGFYYDRGAMMEATLAAIGDLFRAQIHGIRRFGAATLDLCCVGAGQFGGFFEFELAPWDFAAGRLYVTEAGGVVTTCRGEPLPIAKTSLLASNGRLHASLLETLRPHVPARRAGDEAAG
jgi:myo-inositol-1(or 4)-monophosphatase